jgi:hypothetical protein
MAATTTLLGLVTPTQGTLSGTWGDTVNYGISDYVDIAIAGTLSFAGDGAITLANTTGSASGNSIGSTTAQYMVIRITGTQTVTKVITGPSYSKLYMVDHAGATSAVTFKAAGQTGVTVAVGEKCFVYYNGTDYVKVASSVADGVTTIDFGSTGLTPNTATSGAVTVAGTLAVANGGTGITSFGAGIATFLGTPSSANLAAALTDETGSGSAVFATSPTLVTPNLGTPSAAVLTSATGLPLTTGVTGTLPVANGGTGLTAGTSGGIPAYTATGTITSSAALTQYGVLYGGGPGAVPVATAAGTTGQVLTATTGGAPTWAASTGGVTSFSAGTTGFTPSTTTTGAITLAGTLAVANGGTGQTSYTDGQLLIGNTTGNTLTKATLTAGTGISVTNASGSITIATSGSSGVSLGLVKAIAVNCILC